MSVRVSLSNFAKQHNLPKSSIYRRCSELDISTSEGLDQDAIERLLEDLGLTKQDPSPDPELMPEQHAQRVGTTIEAGNHAMVLAAPTLPTAFSLESLRSTEVVQFEDPIAVAQQAIALADQMQAAMAADLALRQANLEAIKQAKNEADRRIDALRLDQLKYQIQADLLNNATTEQTRDLQQSLGHFNSLGKPGS